MTGKFSTKLLTYLLTIVVNFSKIHIYLIFQNKFSMFKGTKVLAFLLLFSWATGLSQQLSNQVLVPVAGLSVTGTLNYSQTIGETAIEIIGNSGFVFTQGFQQPGIKITDDPTPLGTGVDVFPNPVTDNLNIKLFGSDARKYTIEIINITGTILSSTTLDFVTSYYYVKQIDVTWLKLGFYFVRVASFDSKINRIFKIEKM
jgi:hypothetical protein